MKKIYLLLVVLYMAVAPATWNRTMKVKDFVSKYDGDTTIVIKSGDDTIYSGVQKDITTSLMNYKVDRFTCKDDFCIVVFVKL